MAAVQLFVANKTRQVEASEEVGVSQSRLSKAQMILNFAEELANAVMAGTVPLSDAYAEAKQRKEAKESREEKTRRDEVLTDC